MELLPSLALAFGLGLLAFVEPCSVGSHLLFLKYVEQGPAPRRAMQTTLFTLTRAGFMASLGVLAALIGSRFTGLQQALWAALGTLYVVLGLIYLGGGAAWLIRRLNRVLPGAPGAAGSIGLGVLFGLNIPACAGPLLAVLLGNTAAQAAGGGGVAFGASTLFVFGLALSSPLVLAVATPLGRRSLERIARISARMPRWTGAALVVLGGWSLWLAMA